MTNKITTFIKLLLLFSFFTPLIVIPDTYIFPFIVPKIIFFRSLTLLMLGAYLLLLYSNWKTYRIKFTALNLGVFLFLLSFTISTFVGVDIYKSVWDCHERMLGLFTIFHYIAFYFIVSTVVTEWKDWKWIFRIFLGAGFLVMFVGFLQKINPELLLNKGSERVSATLGNAIYFSGYGLFLFLLGIFLAVKEEIKKTNFWFWFEIFVSIFGFFGIFWGGTRGAFLGLLSALFLLTILYVFTLKGVIYKKYKFLAMILILTGILSLILAFNFRKTDFVKSIPALGRLVNTDAGSNNTRIMAWEVAIEAWQEKPIFGWGPNNYYYAFNKYYKPEFLEHGWGETWFDNAHSVIMNTIAVQGLFGILSYLAIYVLVILTIIKFYRLGKIDKHTAFFGLAIILSHLVTITTVFDNPTSYLYFFCFLAFLNSATTMKQETEKKYLERDFSWPLFVIVFLFSILFIYSTDINPARANKAALKTIRALYSGVNVSAEYKNASLIPTPHIDDIRNDFAKISVEILQKFLELNKTQNAPEIFKLAFEEEQKNLELHPLDVRIKITLAELAQLGAKINQDANLLLYADNMISDALVDSPKRQQLFLSGALIKIYMNDNLGAEKLLLQAVESDPKIEEVWWRLAAFYYDTNQKEKAKEAIIRAEKEFSIKFKSLEGNNIKNLVFEK
ncbi:MAG: O-antigen ligase family protein [Patescibacteria group bacterium]